MDCSGTCLNSITEVDTAKWQGYYWDNDGDGHGIGFVGNFCSHVDTDAMSVNNNAEPNTAVADFAANNNDLDDTSYCETNYIDYCGICDGINPDPELGSCGENNINCSNIDCNGDCFGSAFVDYCEECSGGLTGTQPNVTGSCSIVEVYNEIECLDSTGMWFEYVLPKGPSIDCAGVCGGELLIDECGVCNGLGTNGEGICTFYIYPGDTDMNGIVDNADILPIGLYWGKTVQKRDVSGYNSEFSYVPQESDIRYLNCQSFADVNGDGVIGFRDVMGIMMNKGKPHTGFKFLDDMDCGEEGQDLNREVFKQIYDSIEDMDIKEFLSDKFNFEREYKFTLYKNYPNPFNPVTSIVYELAAPSKVEIVVHDLSGRLVTNELYNSQNKGQYSYQWDGNNFSSGIYLFTIFVNNIVLGENKLVLIK